MSPLHLRRLMFAFALLACCASGRAQHIDVLAYDAGNRVGVGWFNFDTREIDSERVFISSFDRFYTSNNPGFVAISGPAALPGSVSVDWDYVPMTVDGAHLGYTSNLLYWDGTGEPEFGPTPTDDYELTLFGLDGPGVARGEAEIVSGDTIDFTDSAGTLHTHPYFFLDDNGDGLNTTVPDPGIYLLSMRLKIDGMGPSDPFFYVWATPDFPSLLATQPAASWVRARVDTLVVEPTPLPGDYNRDGAVDELDYEKWRSTYGFAAAAPGDDADGNADGVVNAADYTVWRDNLPGASSSSAAPEPAAMLLAIAAAVLSPTRNRNISLMGA